MRVLRQGLGLQVRHVSSEGVILVGLLEPLPHRLLRGKRGLHLAQT